LMISQVRLQDCSVEMLGYATLMRRMNCPRFGSSIQIFTAHQSN